ncbi:hypothetical protein AMS68_000450 [Peltaster fructicola]|uniref:DNA ligase n=1 Tax=Peltaster fructicola TaxID=286661 RepID=A0A6H0XJM3_9PEZI|nr:hypothetical protein AMS68_000450 [Peltaster fructicola]
MARAAMANEDAVREEQMMYGHGALTKDELDEKYPNRPHNHSKTIRFADLFLTIFNPLAENRKKPARAPITRSKVGPDGPFRLTPNEVRRRIIERFIARWRKEVGNDIYPAMRLMIPDKDRDRAMYGLKEATIGKLLVKVMKINKDSEDGYNLLHWKLPGLKASSAMAGDFAGRCFEVISKRPMLTSPGTMTIAEVNEMLDRLSVAQKEESQLPIMNEFYTRMNAEELMWLIRMILRQIKIGASEKTILELWHPNAESLFNISSSLRRVCWELYDPAVRLDAAECNIHLMECFQPQLAAFQMRSMEQMVSSMKLTTEDPVFWIEEKLDGERMQLHMIEDESQPGGKRFCFWSRKAKDYTYLYGSNFEDDNSSLTRHIRKAFNEGVRNIILDGEMITWDMERDTIYAFGHLKTAAISEQGNPYATNSMRPLFKVFDCLYLNDQALTGYTLRVRREALEKSLSDVHRRIEIHKYDEARHASEIEPKLRRVVAESTEGLVLKSPRSGYTLNQRVSDWIKVKPDYMSEFGEELDCVVIGGYYGSGKRGGNLSSFMCGLRVPQELIDAGADPQQCYSFFKVGGGFTAADYADVWHRTEGKWKQWDAKKPPTHMVILGGGSLQFEKPDVWIRPEDSVVFEVKAASVTTTNQFGCGFTLRFPRFKKIRVDKDWKQALTRPDFDELRSKAESEKKEKKFKIDDGRKQRRAVKRKRPLTIQGHDTDVAPLDGPTTQLFEGKSFLVLSDCQKPKRSKAEIENLIKANGGTVVASDKDPEAIIISDRNVVKAASIIKRDDRNVIRSKWLYDCIKQSELEPRSPVLPLEPQHLFYTRTADVGRFHDNVDKFEDSYERDADADELRTLLDNMVLEDETAQDAVEELANEGLYLGTVAGSFFDGLTAYFDGEPEQARQHFIFATGLLAISLDDFVTHIVVESDSPRLKDLRKEAAQAVRMPRLVTPAWIEDCWRERTRLDEDRYAPR